MRKLEIQRALGGLPEHLLSLTGFLPKFLLRGRCHMAWHCDLFLYTDTAYVILSSSTAFHTPIYVQFPAYSSRSSHLGALKS